MNNTAFTMAPMPTLHVGPGKVSVLGEAIKPFGKKIILITGAQSFKGSPAHAALFDQLRNDNIEFKQFRIGREPSPAMIDEAVSACASFNAGAVVGIGGGSVLDAAKAISAMLPLNETVKDYLEGVGSKPAHPGIKVPFIAVPTTSGTGSESTRNAVLSEVGEQGYKRSLRHVNFVSNITILDPQLMVSCPPAVTAYSGMDAFTQLLESYLSTGATSLTDLLALEGLKHVSSSLLTAYHNGADINARTGMALAAYLSGITLTNVGLGLVHGLAAVIGGYRDIPHGVICSALMPAANKITVRRLREQTSVHPAMLKYSTAGRLFCAQVNKTDEYYTDHFLQLIATWKSEMGIPGLAAFDITNHDVKKLAAVGENKNNPIPLSRDEITEVLELSL